MLTGILNDLRYPHQATLSNARLRPQKTLQEKPVPADQWYDKR